MTRAEQAVVANLGEALGQDVLQEAAEELQGVARAPTPGAAAAVAIAERHVAGVEAFEATVHEGDAEDVAREILEHLLPGARVLEVNDPFLAPHLARGGLEEAGVAEAIAKLGAEHAGERPAGNEKLRMGGRHPRVIVAMQAAGRHEAVGVQMVAQRPRPGVQDGEQSGAGPEVPWIGGERQEGGGRGRHEQTVDALLVRAAELRSLARSSAGSVKVTKK